MSRLTGVSNMEEIVNQPSLWWRGLLAAVIWKMLLREVLKKSHFNPDCGGAFLGFQTRPVAAVERCSLRCCLVGVDEPESVGIKFSSKSS